jgi:hypothetical protein
MFPFRKCQKQQNAKSIEAAAELVGLNQDFGRRSPVKIRGRCIGSDS